MHYVMISVVKPVFKVSLGTVDLNSKLKTISHACNLTLR
jgi:hypothetical protein